MIAVGVILLVLALLWAGTSGASIEAGYAGPAVFCAVLSMGFATVAALMLVGVIHQ